MGKFVCYGLECVGDVKIIGRENIGCDYCRGWCLEFN